MSYGQNTAPFVSFVTSVTLTVKGIDNNMEHIIHLDNSRTNLNPPPRKKNTIRRKNTDTIRIDPMHVMIKNKFSKSYLALRHNCDYYLVD